MTSDPHDPRYLDEADVRGALTTAFARCGDCPSCAATRRIVPTWFALLDRYDGDAGRFTPAEQDAVVDECFPARWCIAPCAAQPSGDPVAGGRSARVPNGRSSDAPIDIARLMLRANAMRLAHGHAPARAKAMVRLLERGDGGDTNRWSTRLLRSAAGFTTKRTVPQPASQRFSEWWTHRRGGSVGAAQRAITLFVTGPIEWLAPDIGIDAVAVLEHNGVDCSVAPMHASGVAVLEAGAIDRFARVAQRNVAVLVADVLAGRDVIVPDPAARYALRRAYPAHVGASQRADAEVVAAHTYGPAEYLLALHHAADTSLDTAFDVELAAVGDGVAYHRSPIDDSIEDSRGDAGHELLALAGVDVAVVDGCAGIDSMWGLHREYDATVDRLGAQLAARIDPGRAPSGESFFANALIAAHTGNTPRHPLDIVARAYGIQPGG